MGNCCCPPSESSNGNKGGENNSEKKKIQSEPVFAAVPVDFECSLNDISVQVKTGDVSKEIAEALVSGTDNFVKNRSTSFMTLAVVESLNKEVLSQRGTEPLMNGQVVLTGPGDFKNVMHVIHVSVPVWRGGKHKELEQLEEGFKNVLEIATQNRLKSVMFTDVAASLFGIPKQHTASILMQAVKNYAQSYNGENKIKVIKFVHKEKQTVLIFEGFLKEQAGIRVEQAASVYSDFLQGSIVAIGEIDNHQGINYSSEISEKEKQNKN